MFKKFLKSRSGTTAIEYSIIAGMISVAIVAGVTSVGSNTDAMYKEVDEKISASKS